MYSIPIAICHQPTALEISFLIFAILDRSLMVVYSAADNEGHNSPENVYRPKYTRIPVTSPFIGCPSFGRPMYLVLTSNRDNET